MLGRDGSLATTLGYISMVSGRELAFALMVNNVPLPEFDIILDVFNDEGMMTAALQQGL